MKTGWNKVKLQDLVVEAIGGLWGLPSDTSLVTDVDVDVIRGADFRNWDQRRALDAALRRIPQRSLESRRLMVGDLVIEVSGGGPDQPVGRAVVIDSLTLNDLQRPLICSNFCRKLRLKGDVNPYFVKHQLDLLYEAGHTERFQTSTTNIRNLRVQQFLSNTTLVIPDRATQDAIALLVDRVQKLALRSSASLASTLRSITRFREAILSDALSGRLTADWRSDHDYDVADLESQLEAQNADRQLRFVEPEPDWLPDAPPAWPHVTLSMIIRDIEAGKSFRALPRPARAEEWGVVKVSAMSWGQFLEDENKALLPEQIPSSQHEIQEGDLLISRANTVDLVGATVLVGQCRDRLLLSDKSLRLVPMEGISKAWLNYVLGSPAVRAQFADRATGTSDSMRNLSQPKILATTLALPSTEEQDEIVRRLTALLALADALRSRVDVVEGRVSAIGKTVISRYLHSDAGSAA